jgi:hypothetical protein
MQVNQTISKGEMISSLNTEIERLKQDLMATRDKNGIYISAERWGCMLWGQLLSACRCSCVLLLATTQPQECADAKHRTRNQHTNTQALELTKPALHATSWDDSLANCTYAPCVNSLLPAMSSTLRKGPS